MTKIRLKDAIGTYYFKNKHISLVHFNTRNAHSIKSDNLEALYEIILQLKEWRTQEELIQENEEICPETIITLISELQNRCFIMNEHENIKTLEQYEIFKRPINYLNDYTNNFNDLEFMWNNIRTSTVVIIGLGGVGSWVAHEMIAIGVKNLIIIDGDTVDISNLHRQFSYFEDDISKLKVDVIKERLEEKSDELNIVTINSFINNVEDLSVLDDFNIDLIINCSDYPSVDITSGIVAKYCMKKRIPYIIGGGYNMHISLIGQTIMPFVGPCFFCFKSHYENFYKNFLEIENIHALDRNSIGSFTPLCSFASSIISMEAIKVLSKFIMPANTNRRGEFNLLTGKFNYEEAIQRNPNCIYCAEIIE